MLRFAARLVSGLVAVIIVLAMFGQPGARADVNDEPPTKDCIEVIPLVLAGLAVRSGAAIRYVGDGAAYANAGALMGNVLGFSSTYNCFSYLVPNYVGWVCEQSRQGLRFKRTWEARALVSLATKGRHTQC